MKLADLSLDDNTRQAQTVAETIANGAANVPMQLPTSESGAGAVVGSPYATLNGTLMDDDDDDFLPQETSPFNLDDAFEEHTNDFKGKRKKPKQPSASIAKLPTQKAKPIGVNTPDAFLDDNGTEYEYLGRFDGDTSFLDEKYKGVTVKAGDHLYRRNTGVQFDGELAEYEYFIGDDPESSAIFGKLFKGIGKAVKKINPWAIAGGLGIKAASNVFRRKPKAAATAKTVNDITDYLWKKNTNTLGATANHSIRSLSSYAGIEHNGDVYEYVGQSNGDLSFLTQREPNVIVGPGTHLYRVQRTEAFDGDMAEFDYYMGSHPEYSNGIGSFFKKIGKAVGKAAKAVGKGVGKAVKATGKGIGNAAKWTVNKALPVLAGQQTTADESNGVIAPYNPRAGLENWGTGGDEEVDWGDGMYTNPEARVMAAKNSDVDLNIADKPTEQPKSNTLIYVIIAVAALAAIVYLKKHN